MSKTEPAILADLDHWANKQLTQWAADVAMRFDAVDALEQEIFATVTSALLRFSADLIASGTKVSPAKAGAIFAHLVDKHRHAQARKAKERGQ